MAPISLTLVFETPEQARECLEAYGEIMTGSGGAPSVQNTDIEIPPYVPGKTAPAPVPHPNPAPGYEAPKVEVDGRGVPWHPDHHSSSKKQSKGSWDRKRGHDKEAAAAYEAQFLGKSAPAAALITAPIVNAPTPTLVTVAEFQNLWVELCKAAKVTMADQEYIIATWGGHPMLEGAYEDGLKRSQAYAYLAQRQH